MRQLKKNLKEEIKRMQVSFQQNPKEKSRKPNLVKCVKCKKEAGNNFIFVYKKNNELKGKMCISCFHKD